MTAESNLKQKAARGLLWGGIGSGGMQLLNLAFGIVLSRILSPADYGIIGALTVFSAVAAILSESGFTLAIVNLREPSDRDYSSVFWLNLGIGASLYAILFFTAPLIADFYHSPELTSVARFLFVSFLISAVGTVPAGILLRELRIRQRSTMLLIAVAVSGITGVACALAGMAYKGLAVQTVTYAVTYNSMLWLTVKWRPKMQFSWTSIRTLLPFSLKQMAVSLFTHFNNNIFALILGRFYGMRPTGFYTQGNKWTTMGSTTISGMINSVGQPVMRHTVDDPERLTRVFRKILRFAAFVSFPLMFGLGITARELIVIAVTDKWIDAVPVMQILCIGAAFLPLAVVYGNMFNSIGRPGIYMWNTIGVGAAQIVLAVVTYPFGLQTMLTFYVSINILWLIIWQRCASATIGLNFRDALADTLPYMLIAAAVMAVTLLATSSIENIYIAFVSKVLIASTLYCLIMWLTRSVIFRETLQFVLQRFKKNAQ